jgi:HK97 family phage prohead protease
MELRTVTESERVIVGVVAPYDETTYLVPNPSGERVVRGAFEKSTRQRGDKIPLIRGHDHAGKCLGVSRRFTEDPDGLIGEFVVNAGDEGDRLLEDCRNGYYRAMSAGFDALGGTRRGADGAREIVEARLVEVSLVAVPAYAGAGLLAVRSATDVDRLLEPFRNPPAVNLEPIPVIEYRPRRI